MASREVPNSAARSTSSQTFSQESERWRGFVATPHTCAVRIDAEDEHPRISRYEHGTSPHRHDRGSRGGEVSRPYDGGVTVIAGSTDLDGAPR